jgi:membrane protease YdiL (CAAX protease family)
MFFWISIFFSVACILKTKPARTIQKWDILFLLSSWQMFNLGVWKEYLAGSVNGNPYTVAAIILILLLLWYIHRRGIILKFSLLKRDLKIVAQSLVMLALILIPVGLKMGFLSFHPKLDVMIFLHTLLSYVLFVGIPEELVFRGILQNLLARMVVLPLAVLISNGLFAMIYTHLTGNGTFPNWTYVGFAFAAGLIYAISYIRSKSIFVPILVHGLTDTIWRTFLS